MASIQQRYYDENVLTNTYPFVYLEIIKRLKIYFCNLLYPDEPFEKSSKRFIMADFVGGGNEAAIRKSIENYKTSQGAFPFTAYNIDDDEPVEYKSHTHLSGMFYDKDLDCYIAAVPAYLTFNMMTVYNTEYDYYIGTTKLVYDLACLTRLEVPIMVNGKLTQFYVDVEMEVSKGDLAFAYEEQLVKGQLFNISHNLKLKFFYYILASTTMSGGTGKQEALPIYPVDDMVFSLKQLSDGNLIDTVTVNTIPNVTVTTPINNSTNVSTSDPITINFNTRMNEESVVSAMDIVPIFDYELHWNMSSNLLIIDPVSDLSPNTKYTINILKTAENTLTHKLGSDFTLTFTTGT